MRARAASLGATVDCTRRETSIEFDRDRSHVKCDRGQQPRAVSRMHGGYVPETTGIVGAELATIRDLHSTHLQLAIEFQTGDFRHDLETRCALPRRDIV
jgi:hypothetical protein